MPQFKECTVDELLRDSLIEFSLKYNNRTMFDLLTGKDWKDHVVKGENKEKYNSESNQNELHKNEDVLIVFDTVDTLMEVSISGHDLSLYQIAVDWANKLDFCCDLSDIVLDKYMNSNNRNDDEIK